MAGGCMRSCLPAWIWNRRCCQCFGLFRHFFYSVTFFLTYPLCLPRHHPNRSGISIGAALLAGSTNALPGTAGTRGSNNGKPCPIFQDKLEEELAEEAGHGYRQANMRSLASHDGHTGGKVPEGGFAAVEADLINLMTTNNEAWPADFPELGGSYAGLVRVASHRVLTDSIDSHSVARIRNLRLTEDESFIHSFIICFVCSLSVLFYPKK